MNVLDEFTGIGGFAVAARNAGMHHLGFVEIDADCHKVLRRHFPDVRTYNDVEKITEEFESTEPIDLLCGGFPCQDLSVAGQRKGLAGKRSGLWFAMLRSIAVFKPRWIVVENVPGLLSGCGCTACRGVGRLIKTHARIRKSKGGSPCAICVAGERMLKSHSGRNFTTVIQGMVELGYSVAWRIFDSQFDGVAQRRQRVFLVASLGNGSCAEVLFESESGAWNPPPSREAGQRVTGAITADTHLGGFTGQNAASGQYAFGCIGNGEYSEAPATIRAKGGDAGGGSEHLITGSVVCPEVAGTLAASGAGTERPAGQENEPDFLVAAFGGNNQNGSIDIATACNAHGGTGRIDFESETFVTHSLRPEGCDASEDGTGRGMPLVVATLNSGGNSGGFRTEPGEHLISYPLQEISRRTGVSTNNKQHGIGIGAKTDPMYTLQSGAQHGIANHCGVRRLTPTECERLQAFPDGWTAFDEKGNAISDSARYRMLGNAVCRTTAEWILRRIAEVDAL